MNAIAGRLTFTRIACSEGKLIKNHQIVAKKGEKEGRGPYSVTFLPKNGQQVHLIRAVYAFFYRLNGAAHSLNPYLISMFRLLCCLSAQNQFWSFNFWLGVSNIIRKIILNSMNSLLFDSLNGSSARQECLLELNIHKLAS